MKVFKFKECAIVPTKAHKTDAGYDLYACEDGSIYRGNRALVSTGIGLEIPVGYVGLIWPRSGLAVKNGIQVMAGVIDAGYRGEIKVCLHNTNQELDFFRYKHGDKIAQILIQPIHDVELHEVNQEIWENLDSDRGENGFGSTG